MKGLDIQKLEGLRKELHKYPEVSGEEEKTAQRIVDFLEEYEPDQILTGIGGNGIAAVYNGKQQGPGVLFRCELDALPIKEINEMPYKSVYEGKGHKCGHDGHMAMVSGLAQLLHEKRPESGRVVLLYQPEEETGQGAAKVVHDPDFNELYIDYAFALHNLPSFDHGEIVMRKGPFASASKGMIINLQGKSSHAGEPDRGINPSMAVAGIITGFNELFMNDEIFKSFRLITIIHTLIGEVAFGTSPGEAKVMATLRSYLDEDMETLTENAVHIAREIAEKYKLKIDISWTEEFPATINDDNMTGLVKEVAKKNKFSIFDIKEPFRWSEDFAHFTNRYQGALFGLGSGKDQPQLHNPDYDFPDRIIEHGVKMFYGIYDKLLNEKSE